MAFLGEKMIINECCYEQKMLSLQNKLKMTCIMK